ncbi:unnamed protein product [Protopolystoma xenopodis]|uniref:Uncharacterized protein n=1 Tax=Protopolystoma xenopodis TaxID=117903 RepID=A0A3S5A0Y2_9PLAT|nr:unnamed protein product [Protopolystoma xenopodis]
MSERVSKLAREPLDSHLRVLCPGRLVHLGPGSVSCECRLPESAVENSSQSCTSASPVGSHGVSRRKKTHTPLCSQAVSVSNADPQSRFEVAKLSTEDRLAFFERYGFVSDVDPRKAYQPKLSTPDIL